MLTERVLAKNLNRRILVVDDNDAVHDAFRKVLNAPAAAVDLNRFESALFGAEATLAKPEFELDFAFQGAEALEKVNQSLREGRPYALAFVDVRMPPGWDGIETLYQLWKADGELQAVICSAFSDYSWEQITAKLGQTDRLLILKKPFDNIEARQMAYALTEKWNLRAEARQQMAELDASQERFKKLAAENDRLYRDAQHMNNLKDEFLATLSHEMRTPLTSILGWSQLLLRSKVDSAGVERAINAIERNARAQSQLVEDLLDVSRIITGKLRLNMEAVDLRDIIVSALDALAPAVNAKHIHLKVELDTDVPMLRGDAARLQQIVWNLASNAVKFTPEEGKIRVGLRKNGSNAVVSVQDSGVGFAPENLPRLFERFFQADTSSTRAHGGLGLGLAIVRHLVELHGGTVRGESPGADGGATFEISLPLTHVPISAKPNAALNTNAEAPPPNLNGLDVLVVEDESDTRELVSLILSNGGARVTAVKSVEEALAAVEKQVPALMVSDIRLPFRDGYSLIRELRRRGQRFPAIALTAFGGHDDRLHCLAEGFQRHIAKPIDPDRLLINIAELAGLR
jgi:signal transduction histidine kinase